MNRLLPIFAFVMLPLVLPAEEPQLGGLNPLKRKQSEEEKERKEREKSSEKAAKNETRYLKLKNYSVNKYQNDVEFRDEVDQAFGDLLRDHSDRAYERNINRDSYIRTVHEDNWRVHLNLYDNLRVQDYINRIGQQLVPEGSEKLYAFKVIPDPIPSAETLATGTIYVSTGLLSLLDSQAQLAYILAHEMGHVHLDHWKERVMMERGADEYAKDQSRKIAKWALLGTIAGAGLGAGIGAGLGNAGQGAGIGAVGGGIGGLITGFILNRPLLVDWDRAEEDTADDLAFKQTLSANYDVREIPNLYLAMEKVTARDSRMTLGFLGNRKRITQRREKAEDLIKNSMSAEIELRLKKGFLASSAEHRNLMAELKRDNGIMAYYHDMFDLARNNLSDAAAIRDNDPAVHYFYGKVLKLVGRTDEERRLAAQSFVKASGADYRNQNYGAHLHAALLMLEEQAEKKMQIDPKVFAQDLDDYVTNYARWNIEHGQMRMFPPNMDSIYEYMRLYGDKGWRPKPPRIEELTNYNEYYLLNPEGRAQSAGANIAPGSGSVSNGENAPGVPANVVNSGAYGGRSTAPGATPAGRVGTPVRPGVGAAGTVTRPIKK